MATCRRSVSLGSQSCAASGARSRDWESLYKRDARRSDQGCQV